MPALPNPIPGALLLCVDMQPTFLSAIADGPRVLRRAQFAVAAAVGLGIPVAFTEQVPQKLGGTAPDLLSLTKKPAVYEKNTFSVFGDDGIRETLRDRQVEHLILCGLETPICIYQTAIGALDENMQVTVLTDAVGARRADDAAACLAALARNNVHLLPSETVFYSLLHSTQHPFFKAYTKLVKQHG